MLRAFGWVVTFRDFPAGSWQTVGGEEMMRDALTLFTKGRAEFYLNGERRQDRVPGVLSSEHDKTWDGGTFTLKYVEPTTRVCIPRLAKANRRRLPDVTKVELKQGETLNLAVGTKLLVCLGELRVGERVFGEEQHLHVQSGEQLAVATKYTILLDFTYAPRPLLQS